MLISPNPSGEENIGLIRSVQAMEEVENEWNYTISKGISSIHKDSVRVCKLLPSNLLAKPPQLLCLNEPRYSCLNITHEQVQDDIVS
jgi:hypothetical protein